MDDLTKEILKRLDILYDGFKEFYKKFGIEDPDKYIQEECEILNLKDDLEKHK